MVLFGGVISACHSARPVVRQVGEDQYIFQNRHTGRTVGGPYQVLFGQLAEHVNKALPRRSMVVEWNSAKHQFWLLNAWGNRVERAFLHDGLPDELVEGRVRCTNEARQVGFLNRRGRMQIPARYTVAFPFYHGFSVVSQGCQQEPICPGGDTEHTVWRGGKWGVIDRHGRAVVPVQYDALYYVDGHDDWLAAVKNADTILIERNGKPVPPQPYKANTQACNPAAFGLPRLDSISQVERQGGSEWGKP